MNYGAELFIQHSSVPVFISQYCMSCDFITDDIIGRRYFAGDISSVNHTTEVNCLLYYLLLYQCVNSSIQLRKIGTQY